MEVEGRVELSRDLGGVWILMCVEFENSTLKFYDTVYPPFAGHLPLIYIGLVMMREQTARVAFTDQMLG